MTKLKINKKALYEKVLEQSVVDENYESAAMARDILAKIKEDEIIEIEDDSDTNKDIK